MIKLPNEDRVDEPLLSENLGQGTSSSGSHALLPLVAEDLPTEPPPEFSTYEATYQTDSSLNIISHDPHLNTDGEALYRFILQHAITPPCILLHIKSTHPETRTRSVTSTVNGRTETRTESYTETAVDFDFWIDMSRYCTGANGDRSTLTQFTASDSDPIYRGRTFREVETHTGKRRAHRVQVKTFKRWCKQRDTQGLPPWVAGSPDTVVDIEYDAGAQNALMSSKTLREWADEYCASDMALKEFTYRKVVYGWDMSELTSRIRGIVTVAATSDSDLAPIFNTITAAISAISATRSRVGVTDPFYRTSSTLTVDIEHSRNTISIRPPHLFSRLLSNVWMRVLLWITLIYPFIWLYKTFHAGGRWEVAGGAWGLLTWVEAPLQAAEPNSTKTGSTSEPPPDYSVVPSGSNSNMRITRDGRRVYRRGFTPEEWVDEWQTTIARAVKGRYKSTEPIYTPWR